MFICIVARGYPSLNYETNGIFEFDQACALKELGHKVIFVAIDLRSIRRWRKWGIEHFIKDGVEVYAINIPLGRLPHYVLRYVGQIALLILYRLIHRNHGEPDFVHAHFLNIAEIALVLKARTNAKFVVTEHSSILNGEYTMLPKWIQNNAKSIYSRYNKVICVSPMLANSLKTFWGIKDIEIIPNILDPIFLFDKRGMHNSFNFVFVGRMENRKCPLETIEAFYDAFYTCNFDTISGQTIKLYLIGSGPLYGVCLEYIKKLKLENNVFMLGQIPRKKIAEVMQKSDCFVLPSKLETFGVVYIEAMACGLPVIASKCGGPEYFVNEDTGVLIDTGQHEELVKSFRYMLNNIDKYDNDHIAEYTKKFFSAKVIADKIADLYTQLNWIK